MKKLITCAAICCASLFGFAATVDWTTAGIQLTGDFDEGTGDYAAGYAVYLFNNSGAYTQTQMLSLITAGTGWENAFTGDTKAYIGSAVADDDGAFVGEVTVADGDFSGYLVIFDAESYDKATYAFVSETYDASDNSMHKMALDYDGDTWVNALDYSTAGQNGSNWHSVPEPTSGLLLLVGGALLALKRRRA